MRLRLVGALALAVLAPAAGTGADKTAVELRSDLLVSGLPLAESDKGVYGVRLTARVDRGGDGSGTLELDPNVPAFDEFGFRAGAGRLDPVKLECTLKVAKRQKLMLPESGRVAAPLVEVEWVRYEVRGPKITSPLFLATEEKSLGQWARLLVQDRDGKVKYSVPLKAPPPPEPCHPGCFPAGTPILTPGGPKAVESLRAGDVVTTVGSDGTAGRGAVASVFVTTNRLIEVRTEAGTLTTTETQPLGLASGGLRAAGELKAGDRVFTWDGRERRAVAVRSVEATGREARVYNVVLGDPVLFVADGYLARSKPPAPATDSTRP